MAGSWKGLVGLAVACAAAAAHAATQGKPVLAVCADPANLPYSSNQQPGFENRIADLLAADLGAPVRYTWFPEHRVFFRRTLLDGLCDVVISVPTALPIVAVTKPVFVSSYVAVTRSADPHRFTSFDDPWLLRARIGLQLVGAEGATTPPAIALSRRGANQHITGFPMWADDSVQNPQGRIVDAVADGSIDIAFVWGPFAGYFAKPHGAALRLAPVTSDPKSPEQTFVFPMSIGVRKADTALRDRLQGALDRHAPEIAAILADYGVPIPPPPPPDMCCPAHPVLPHTR